MYFICRTECAVVSDKNSQRRRILCAYFYFRLRHDVFHSRSVGNGNGCYKLSGKALRSARGGHDIRRIFLRQKIGQTLSAVLGTGVIGLIGYDSLNLTQNAIDGLYTVSTAVPAASCLLMSVLLGFVYNLGKKNLSSIYSD